MTIRDMVVIVRYLLWEPESWKPIAFDHYRSRKTFPYNIMSAVEYLIDIKDFSRGAIPAGDVLRAILPGHGPRSLTEKAICEFEMTHTHAEVMALLDATLANL
jgi:hypothetical protein